MNEKHEALIADALFGELSPEDQLEFERLMSDDEAFQALFEEMRGTLDVMDRRERRDPGDAYWEGYWDRLQARMAGETGDATDVSAAGRSSKTWWRRRVVEAGAASWAVRVAAAAAILVVGMYMGRTLFVPSPQVAVAPADSVGDGAPGSGTVSPPPQPVFRDVADAQPASADDRARRYVEKSRVLLLALVNTDPSDEGYSSSMQGHQKRSRALVAEASSIKEELDSPKQQRLRELVGELEKILVQIANLEAEEDPEEVEFIKGRVNDHDVMLKINLEQLYGGKDGNGTGASGDAPGETDTKRSI
jgi:hypothetical protein